MEIKNHVQNESTVPVFAANDAVDQITSTGTDPLIDAIKSAIYIICYSMITITAVGGNGIVIYLIVNYRKMRTVTNMFILNLAIGDLLMAMLCIPFSFISNLLINEWPFGAPMCPIVSFSQAVSVFISAYTHVAISIDRYIAIIYPLRPRMTRRHSLHLIGVIWLVALLTPVPTALFSKLKPINKCDIVNETSKMSTISSISTIAAADIDNLTISDYVIKSNTKQNNNNNNNNHHHHQNYDNHLSEAIDDRLLNYLSTTRYQCDEDWSWLEGGDDCLKSVYRLYYSMLLMALQYGLPFSVLVWTYSRIACVVWGKRAPGEADDSRDARIAASKRKMTKMMIICVVTFTLCWLPFNIFLVYADLHKDVYTYEVTEYVWFVFHWLAMSHSSMQPIIYVWMNARFRYGFRCVLGRCLPFMFASLADRGNGVGVTGIGGTRRTTGITSAAGGDGNFNFEQNTFGNGRSVMLTNVYNSGCSVVQHNIIRDKKNSAHIQNHNIDKSYRNNNNAGDGRRSSCSFHFFRKCSSAAANVDDRERRFSSSNVSSKSSTKQLPPLPKPQPQPQPQSQPQSQPQPQPQAQPQPQPQPQQQPQQQEQNCNKTRSTSVTFDASSPIVRNRKASVTLNHDHEKPRHPPEI